MYGSKCSSVLPAPVIWLIFHQTDVLFTANPSYQLHTSHEEAICSIVIRCPDRLSICSISLKPWFGAMTQSPNDAPLKSQLGKHLLTTFSGCRKSSLSFMDRWVVGKGRIKHSDAPSLSILQKCGGQLLPTTSKNVCLNKLKYIKAFHLGSRPFPKHLFLWSDLHKFLFRVFKLPLGQVQEVLIESTQRAAWHYRLFICDGYTSGLIWPSHICLIYEGFLRVGQIRSTFAITRPTHPSSYLQPWLRPQLPLGGIVPIFSH